MKPKKPPKKEIMKVIESSFGNLSTVAAKFGVSRRTVKGWINKDKSGDLLESCEEGKECMVDYAENQAMVLMKRLNQAAILKILTTLGKNRGYVEQKRYDPNVIGELDLTTTTTGQIDLTIKHVIINSREDLNNVYKGDGKRIEDKTTDSALDTVDADFLEVKPKN